MRVAIQQVKGRRCIGAGVSAGNTGALMAIARYLLKTLDGINHRHRHQMPNATGGATTVLIWALMSIARPNICFSLP